MSKRKQALPPLTPELIAAARAYPPRWRSDQSVQWKRLRAYRDEVDFNMLIVDAAIHVLNRALDEALGALYLAKASESRARQYPAHRPIPNKGTKVGDVVRVCHNAGRGPTLIGRVTVEAICPFRGVLTHYGWFRSWTRVKGGGQ